ncbi:MAG: N-acetyl sugar amidotransferase [Candidatus Omnitrophica bacterium]|nr:N-acetyl sugar amidotransferase [Candidatus Omnitrophota bacterium]
MAEKANILVVYHHRYSFPMRETLKDYLYSFARHSTHRVFYLNTAFGVPRYILGIDFDLVIFPTIFLTSIRWSRLPYSVLVRKTAVLKKIDAVKIALTQDEFIRTDVISQFINGFGISAVFSVAEEGEWKKIYPDVDRSKVKFARVLTGYLEEKTLRKIQRLFKRKGDRPVDIGYRANKAPYWLGRHGYLKTKIADLFKEYAPKRRFRMDISTEKRDLFLGFDWYRFLLNCKYFIGVEGGSSILDKDGSIRDKAENYLADNPNAGFEEVEEACFKGLDGGLNISTISPRHLEACATRTCQILVEGDYNGILKPNLHYIPLKKDFSNIEEVLKIIKNDSLRGEIVERAYRDIVESQRFTYKDFVRDVLAGSLKSVKVKRRPLVDAFLYFYNRLREWLIWMIVALEGYSLRLVFFFLPSSWVQSLRRLRYRLENVKGREIVKKRYQICTTCIMDTTDPDIEFDEKGICNHCKEYCKAVERYIPKEKEKEFKRIIDKIKKDGRNKNHDCITGISGGVDSTYLLYLTLKWGLRPLVMHLDNEWNSDTASENIEKITKALGVDLYTYKVNWKIFKDLQLAYFKASVVDIEFPTDHLLMAVLYETARKRGIGYVLSGYNVMSEYIMPKSWYHNKYDLTNLKDIYNQFGTIRAEGFPTLGRWKKLYYQFIKNIRFIYPLHYIDYIRNDAKKFIKEELGWKDYGGKHCESLFTRFYQMHILPRKFNIDKRRSHLSTLICSEQITREEALKEIEKPTYPEEELKRDKGLLLKKFDITEEEFERLMNLPIRSHFDFKSDIRWTRAPRFICRRVLKIKD